MADSAAENSVAAASSAKSEWKKFLLLAFVALPIVALLAGNLCLWLCGVVRANLMVGSAEVSI